MKDILMPTRSPIDAHKLGHFVMKKGRGNLSQLGVIV
jgi:hypothetical protein